MNKILAVALSLVMLSLSFIPVGYALGESFDFSDTLMEQDSDALSLIGGDAVFMWSNDSYFADGVKQHYPSGRKAYFLNGDIRLPSEVVNAVFGTSEKANTYVRMQKSYVTGTLGKNIYTDPRGFAVISDTVISDSNHALVVENTERMDVIYRYMQFVRPGADDIYSSLIERHPEKGHPRLFKNGESGLNDWVAKTSVDTELLQNLPALESKINTNYKTPVVYEESEAGKIFGSCKAVRDRMIDYITAYYLTKKDEYANMAIAELINVCDNFKDSDDTDNINDWNLHDHYLDSGKLGVGMALGFDMLYDKICAYEGLKEKLLTTLWDKYLNYVVENVYQTDGSYTFGDSTQMTRSNWGMVCATSQLMVSLAIIDEYSIDSSEAKKLEYIIQNSMKTLELMATSLSHDGSWVEGIGYNEYMLEHMAWSILSLENALGSDFGFASCLGVGNMPLYAMSIAAPEGSFNFDSSTGVVSADGTASNFAPNTLAPEAMLIASLAGNNSLYKTAKNYCRLYTKGEQRARFMLFCDNSITADAMTLSNQNYFPANGIYTYRSDWEDESGLYLAVNGGYTSRYYNAHCDKGSFIFDAMGERWFLDLGRNATQTDSYLKRADMHNVLVIDPGEDIGQLSDVGGVAWSPKLGDNGASISYNLTSLYADKGLKKYYRGFLVEDNKKSLTIKDEVQFTGGTHNLEWTFLTELKDGEAISLSDDKKAAQIIKGSKTLRIEALCSASDWSFEIRNGEPHYGFDEATNKSYIKNVKKLILKADGVSGLSEMSIKFMPEYDGKVYAPIYNGAISGMDDRVVSGSGIEIVYPKKHCLADTDYIKAEFIGEPELISFYLDGKKLGDTEDGILSVPKGIFIEGSCSLEAHALYADGNTAVDKRNLNVFKKEAIQSKYLDFTGYTGDADYSKISISSKDKASFTLAEGKDGADDTAIYIEHNANDSVSTNIPSIKIIDIAGYNDGITVLEFDVKARNIYTDSLRLNNISLWSNSFNVFDRGIFANSHTALKQGWNHVKIANDYTSGRACLWVNDNIVYEGSLGSYQYYKDDAIIFEIPQNGTRSMDTRAGIYLDNISLEQYKYSADEEPFKASRPWIVKDGDEYVSYCKIKDENNTAKKVSLILALYEGNELKDISITSLKNDNYMEARYAKTKGVTRVAAFVMDCFGTLTPYSEKTEIEVN